MARTKQIVQKVSLNSGPAFKNPSPGVKVSSRVKVFPKDGLELKTFEHYPIEKLTEFRSSPQARNFFQESPTSFTAQQLLKVQKDKREGMISLEQASALKNSILLGRHEPSPFLDAHQQLFLEASKRAEAFNRQSQQRLASGAPVFSSPPPQQSSSLKVRLLIELAELRHAKRANLSELAQLKNTVLRMPSVSPQQYEALHASLLGLPPPSPPATGLSERAKVLAFIHHLKAIKLIDSSTASHLKNVFLRASTLESSELLSLLRSSALDHFGSPPKGMDMTALSELANRLNSLIGAKPPALSSPAHVSPALNSLVSQQISSSSGSPKVILLRAIASFKDLPLPEKAKLKQVVLTTSQQQLVARASQMNSFLDANPRLLSSHLGHFTQIILGQSPPSLLAVPNAASSAPSSLAGLTGEELGRLSDKAYLLTILSRLPNLSDKGEIKHAVLLCGNPGDLSNRAARVKQYLSGLLSLQPTMAQDIRALMLNLPPSTVRTLQNPELGAPPSDKARLLRAVRLCEALSLSQRSELKTAVLKLADVAPLIAQVDPTLKSILSGNPSLAMQQSFAQVVLNRSSDRLVSKVDHPFVPSSAQKRASILQFLDGVASSSGNRPESSKPAFSSSPASASAYGVPWSSLLTEPTWSTLLKDDLLTPPLRQLSQLLGKQSSKANIYPPASLVFNALNLCPPDRVKVVLLGQDPYHGPGQAMGLSFSVPPGCPLPPSLRNIYREIASDIGPIPKDPTGDLTSWAQQGVLLLNATLTVEQAKPNIHENLGWVTLTDRIISLINETSSHPVVFLLWGAFAQKKAHLVTRKDHLILNAAHPSPLSAFKFFGCRHFSLANAHLQQSGQSPISWRSPFDHLKSTSSFSSAAPPSSPSPNPSPLHSSQSPPLSSIPPSDLTGWFRWIRSQGEIEYPISFVAQPAREILLLVGFPGSGKSNFYRETIAQAGYAYINRDTLLTIPKCLSAAKTALLSQSVVIDNTNLSVDSRQPFIQLARSLQIPIRCIHLQVPRLVSQYLNDLRSPPARVPPVAYKVLLSKFTLPLTSEGFSEIITISNHLAKPVLQGLIPSPLGRK